MQIIKSFSIKILLSMSILCGQNIITKDYLRTISQVGAFIYLEYGISDENEQIYANNEPNEFDTFFRNSLKWKNEHIEKANFASDILIYGAFLGSIPITPMLSFKDYKEILLLNLDVMSTTGIITNMVKMLSKRQRPSSYFGILDEGKESHRSFFSGHTSLAFSIGTSNAMLLSKIFPEKKNVIWVANIGLASLTGFFRIAADKHYMTDVIFGGIAGYLIGKAVFNRYNGKIPLISLKMINNNPYVNLSFNIE